MPRQRHYAKQHEKEVQKAIPIRRSRLLSSSLRCHLFSLSHSTLIVNLFRAKNCAMKIPNAKRTISINFNRSIDSTASIFRLKTVWLSSLNTLPLSRYRGEMRRRKGSQKQTKPFARVVFCQHELLILGPSRPQGESCFSKVVAVRNLISRQIFTQMSRGTRQDVTRRTKKFNIDRRERKLLQRNNVEKFTSPRKRVSSPRNLA